ncbi:hypothetical protein C5167_037554 [Papaver somniferum]|uniref:mannan endo-1,4-beta-mannosidase n=1 Tax=Papaver somniferum TaxID=3469 RepID=A0A4Y7IAS1_PAPSO|nr:mannan endo-1,4-beta-mannosidase 7-like [Papaver somniferum]RZC44608.1 hypothetical protein C5167_037554 [Papaver somniferum]
MRHWGLGLLLILVLIQQQNQDINNRVEATTTGDFIRIKGTQFMLNGSPYYANGFNAYWLMLIASDPSQRSKVSSVFQQASKHGLSVARTWAFSDAGYRPLQSSPGSYNEDMFKGLDFVVAEAKKYQIKLILSLVNNYENFGGRKQYVEWARNQGQYISSEDDFYTNPVVKGFYKNHVKTVLRRHNSITGVAYMDDPTIMSWELINEPRCLSDLSGKTIQAWITEMASHVKSIDRKHLLEAGLEGFYGDTSPDKKQYNPGGYQVGTDFIANNQIPGIDFATVHSYPDQWLSSSKYQGQLSFLNNWLNTHIHDAQNVLWKPLLLTEFGKSWKSPGYNPYQRDFMFNTVFYKIYSSARSGGATAGGLFWQLLPEGMDSFHDGYEIIFSENPSIARIIDQQSRKLVHIRRMYAKLRNIEKWKRARSVRRNQWFGKNKKSGNTGN